MSLDYDTYVSQLANLMAIASSDPNFQKFLPGNIDYSEQRIYRELDLVNVQVTDASAQVSSGNRNFTLPTTQGTFITVDNLNIITPANTASSLGSRVPLMPVSADFIDLTYPSASQSTGTPKFYGRRDGSLVIFGPSPDAAYFAEVIGIQRPTPLSSMNSSTILTQYVPDLFMAAACVHAFGYMRDFGGQSDNPQSAQSWENQYQVLMKSAMVEQARAKFEAEGWTSQQPSPIASPPRV